MNWKTLTAATIAMIALWSTNVNGQELSLEARLQNNYKLRGLPAKKYNALQPRIRVSDGTLSIRSYGNLNIDKAQADFYVLQPMWSDDLGPVSASAWYANIFSAGNPEVRGTQEFGAKITAEKIHATAAYDFEGAHAWYLQTGINQSAKVFGQDVQIGSTLRADNGYFRNKQPMSLRHASIGASTNFETNGITITPTVDCGVALGAGSSSECLFGIRAAYKP